VTIFGDWLRERSRRIARATAGDPRAAAQLAGQDAADPLGVDLEATRQVLEARIDAEQRRQAVVNATRAVPCVGAPEECRKGIRVPTDAPPTTYACSARCRARAEERKEQSIIAALVFGCSCGWRFGDALPTLNPNGVHTLAGWLRVHSRCAGLGAMVREAS